MNKRKDFRSKRPLNSVDGMLPAGSSGLQQDRHFSKNQHSPTPQAGLNRGRLDDFNTKEGFHPSKQPMLRTSTQDNPRPLGREPNRGPDGMIDLELPEAPVAKRKRRLRPIRWFKALSRKKKFVAVGATLAAMLLVFFGVGFWRLHNIFRGGGGAAALQDNVDPSRLRGEGDGRVNILLLGKGGPGHTAPDLTDTLLVASIDPINKKAALLSIPRDLWVTPDGYSPSKINSVYANAKSSATYAGKRGQEAEDLALEAIDKTVEKTMGIPIHYHVMVDFEAFRKSIDTVGGIDLDIDENGTVYEVLWDESTGRHYTLNVQQGRQHFDGTRALFYSRSRYTSPRGDFDRTERQRKVILALKDKVLSLGTFANPAKVTALMNDFGSHIQANMTIGEVMRLYDISKTIESNNVASLGLADPPNDFVMTDNLGGVSIVRPKAGLSDFSKIQSFVRNSLKDGFIANEDAKIVVLNGTSSAGLATDKAEELKSYGYNVIKVDTAPTQNYSNTILIDLRSGSKKYTKHYLEQRLQVSSTGRLPDNNIQPGEADFVIILGQNEVR